MNQRRWQPQVMWVVILSSVISSVALLVSAAALNIVTFSRHVPAIQPVPAICQEFAAKMPQTPEGISEKYGLPVERIELFAHYQCYLPQGDIYWAFYVKDGDPVTIEVPEGGEILMYRGISAYGDDTTRGTYYFSEGVVTGNHMIVQLKPSSYRGR